MFGVFSSIFGPRLDPKFRELTGLPVGIEVTHLPNPVPPQEGGRSGHRYSWINQTTVRATERPLTVIEFGALAWHDGRWVFSNFTGKPFAPEDFAEWYECPGARLDPGRQYTDSKNWTGSNHLSETRSLWYYIAVDDDGRRFKGEGVLVGLAVLPLSRGSL